MNGRRSKELRKVMGEKVESGRTWYDNYCKSAEAMNKNPLGMPAIKKLAKGKTKKFIFSHGFKDLIWENT